MPTERKDIDSSAGFHCASDAREYTIADLCPHCGRIIDVLVMENCFGVNQPRVFVELYKHEGEGDD